MTNVAQTTYKLNPFSEPLSAPPELASRRNWICWRADPDYGKDGKLKPKPKKTPIIVGPGTSSAWQRPENHVSYDEAVAAVQKHNLSGVGFVLTPGCGLIGGDLDGCRDPVTGVIEPWAQAIIDKRETYFEVSPSGKRRPVLDDNDLPLTESENVGRDRIVFLGAVSDVHRRSHRRDAVGDRPGALRSGHADETTSRRTRLRRPPRPRSRLRARLRLDRSRRKPVWRKAYRKSPMGQINEAAMKDFDAWVPELLPSAEHSRRPEASGSSSGTWTVRWRKTSRCRRTGSRTSGCTTWATRARASARRSTW